MDKVKGIIFAALSAATFGLIPLYANQAIIDGIAKSAALGREIAIDIPTV